MIKRLFVIVFLITSCKTTPGSDRDYDKFDPNKTYKLQLNPSAGTSYHYDIVNESETTAEVNDKKVEKETKTELGVFFKVSKDSTDNLLLNISYDKVRLHTKSGDNETDADAANVTGLSSPVEKMLGMLKETQMVASVSASGEVEYINGYEQLGDKILSAMDANDPNAVQAARAQWDQQIGNGLVKGNLDQLFKVFPDSAVHLRDEWKVTSKQEGEMGLIVKSTFKLKAINNDIAIIGVEGIVTSDKNAGSMMGMNNATIDLKGDQEGEFQMETKTGMLINGSVKVKLNGTITAMGREVPVTIKTSVKIDGRRL